MRANQAALSRVPKIGVLWDWAKDIGRLHVSETAGISTGIAKRYATAVFDLATEGKAIKALESDVAALEAAMTESADLRTLLKCLIDTLDAVIFHRKKEAR